MTDLTLKIDESRLDTLLAAARERALGRNRPVLATLTQRVSTVDPLSALKSVARAALSNERLEMLAEGGRMYWACPRDEFSLAGIGAAAIFAPEGHGRFASVDSAWSALLADAVTDNPDEGTPGVGPMLMGGFAFDPNAPQTGLWEGFPSAHLIVPRLLLTSSGEKCWATISVLVGADGQPDADIDALAALLRAAGDASIDQEIVTGDAASELSFTESRTAAEWRSLVSAAVGEICSGEMQKVVVAREVRATASEDIDVFATLRNLREAHQNSFVFGYWRGDTAFVGATPERLVRLDGRDVRASSLAGTEMRGTSPAEDDALAALLLRSAKDLAEHSAVRDALYEALSEISDEVEAPETPSLLTLPHLHHLHTPVRAHLRAGHSLLDVVARLHPTPAVGGTPRVAALHFLKTREGLDRGWYAAPIGWIGRDSGEFAVALRSAVIAGSEATLFAGCGIVADSDPELEYRESDLKLRSMQSAIASALGSGNADGQTAMSEIGATTEVSR